MPDNAHVLDLLPAFALGSLDADEVSHVEQHLLSCMICRDELRSFEAVTAQLGRMASEIDPSAHLKDRLMQRVRAERVPVQTPSSQKTSRSVWERLLPAWSVAGLVLLIGLGALNLFLWQRLNDRSAFIGPGGMRAVPLYPVNVASQATGFVIVSMDGDSGALVVDGLPSLEENQQYQLWLILDGERTSGAVFSTDEKKYGGTRIRAPRSLLDYTAVEITIEPVGGSQQPTGPQVLGGTLRTP